MAESVLEVALENLGSLIQNELGLILRVNQEMKMFSNTLTEIRAVPQDAEDKQLTNKALKNWLYKLQDAAHLLDDILDGCSTEALVLESQGLLYRTRDKDSEWMKTVSLQDN
ncbi:putative disease resistance protein RGA3 isoform X2 [Prosopis cineraria]|uniref:putative disease resistance protein RGA3 isoform X2 n=1 Tax=Prosopis cineraria TaxID=364024 RepID=UPI00240F73DE|nr:putative disease resistance protein RGA3 isoform X2 [Prosopis cineraria]